jgi:hypothetical protein
MMRGKVYLPGSKPPKAAMLFEVGAQVRLLSCPHGLPGVVVKALRSRVVVRWPQFNFTGRYRPERLVLAAAEAADGKEGK